MQNYGQILFLIIEESEEICQKLIMIEKHPEIAFEKLKNINFQLAELCLQHHNKDVDEKMKIFQELDDK